MAERVAVFGSRNGVEPGIVGSFCSALYAREPHTILVSGGASGADTCAEQTWLNLGGRVISFRPIKLSDDRYGVQEWRLGSPSACIIELHKEGHPTFATYGSACIYRDSLIAERAGRGAAFHEQHSRGTAVTIDFFRGAGKPIHVRTGSSWSEPPPMPERPAGTLLGTLEVDEEWIQPATEPEAPAATALEPEDIGEPGAPITGWATRLEGIHPATERNEVIGLVCSAKFPDPRLIYETIVKGSAKYPDAVWVVRARDSVALEAIRSAGLDMRVVVADLLPHFKYTTQDGRDIDHRRSWRIGEMIHGCTQIAFFFQPGDKTLVDFVERAQRPGQPCSVFVVERGAKPQRKTKRTGRDPHA